MSVAIGPVSRMNIRSTYPAVLLGGTVQDNQFELDEHERIIRNELMNLNSIVLDSTIGDLVAAIERLHSKPNRTEADMTVIRDLAGRLYLFMNEVVRRKHVV